MHLRLLERKRLALSKTRLTAERKLEEAERALKRCGPLSRRRRDGLRAEIELQRRSIDLVGANLVDLAAMLEQTRPEGRCSERVRGDAAKRWGAQELGRSTREREARRLTRER